MRRKNKLIEIRSKNDNYEEIRDLRRTIGNMNHIIESMLNNHDVSDECKKVLYEELIKKLHNYY